MTRLANLLMSFAVALLPQQERRRYAEEFEAELRSQHGWGRIAYAVSTRAGGPHLRWELLCRLAGQRVPFCFLGMHRDLTVHPNAEEQLIVARECILCHRTRDPSQYAPRENPQGLGRMMQGHY